MQHALKVSIDFSAGHGYRWSRHKGNRKSDVSSWPDLSQNLSAVCLPEEFAVDRWENVLYTFSPDDLDGAGGGSRGLSDNVSASTRGHSLPARRHYDRLA